MNAHNAFPEKAAVPQKHYAAVEQQHQLVGNGVEQQRQRGGGDAHTVPSHVVQLHGLSSRGGGSDGGKVKACKGVATALAELYRLL